MCLHAGSTRSHLNMYEVPLHNINSRAACSESCVYVRPFIKSCTSFDSGCSCYFVAGIWTCEVVRTASVVALWDCR